MEIVRDIREGHAKLTLSGRFDATWSEGVADVLGECVRAGAHVVHLDLANVVFLSSAGIRVLLGSWRELSRIGGSLTVTRASDPVFTVLQLSGLTELLQVRAAATPVGDVPPALRFEHVGARIERWDLGAGSMRVRTVGDPAAVFDGRASAAASTRLAFPKSTFGVGVAAFGRDADDCAGRFGEFLAVGGAALCHANGDGALPDWVLAEGQLIPEAEMRWGLVGEGAFATELRFEAAESATGVLTMADLVELALTTTDDAPAVLAMVAETSQLVGAALRGTGEPGSSMFTFPAVRDRLLFTAEPAWTDAVALVVGVVARGTCSALAPLLRPLLPDGSRTGHLHAAAFPYRPLRKGRVDLDATLGHLFEDQSVRALLHLIHDWREPVGAGQSAFSRGVIWTSPLEAA